MSRATLVGANRRRYTLSVFIGRLSPPHLGHLAVILQALQLAEIVLIVIGSANAARRFDHVPFTAAEREQMIRLMLTPEQNRRVRFSYVEDRGNMTKWSGEVRSAAFAIEPNNRNISLIGHNKDASSFYLSGFPNWDSSDVENYLGLSATPYREDFFSTRFIHDTKDFLLGWKDAIHPDVQDWLLAFTKTAEYDYMVREAAFCENYRKQWGEGPFFTGDLVLIQGDYVLMVERGAMPFEGKLAFPGGFVNRNERVIDAAYREGGEETGLKVPMKVLRQSYVTTRFYDEPYRDPRARIISGATLVYLNPVPPASMIDPEDIRKFLALPRVKGADDARAAHWKHIPSIRREDTAFDHKNILEDMIDLIPANKDF